jgi:hypothetical protein
MSIQQALPIVKCGKKWKVGSGENVRVFHDNWLANKSGKQPSMHIVPNQQFTFQDLLQNG